MNKRKVESLTKLAEKMNKDKKLKGLKIYPSVWDYGRGRVDMSIEVENLEKFSQVNYIRFKYNLETSSNPNSQMTFRRVI